MSKITLFLLIAIYAATSSATMVVHCGSGLEYENNDLVKISQCNEPPCVFKRRSKISVEQTIVPQEDVQSLTTSVYAYIFNLPVPFIGVNGFDACNSIFNADGTKASCPLTKGKQYVYKNSFPILDGYPRINLVVHWALTQNSKDIACFEVPAKITS